MNILLHYTNKYLIVESVIKKSYSPLLLFSTKINSLLTIIFFYGIEAINSPGHLLNKVFLKLSKSEYLRIA